MLKTDELSGWKEIAAHLDVSVRTAQGYEKNLGLPVRRQPGQKGRVWASVEELDGWRLARPEQRNSEKDVRSSLDGAPLPTLPLADPRSKRPNFLLWPLVAVLVVILVGAVYSVAHLRPAPTPPTPFPFPASPLPLLSRH